jgi:hypothetical protein
MPRVLTLLLASAVAAATLFAEPVLPNRPDSGNVILSLTAGAGISDDGELHRGRSGCGAAAERHADLVRPCRLPFAEEDGNRNPSFLGAVFSTRMIS